MSDDSDDTNYFGTSKYGRDKGIVQDTFFKKGLKFILLAPGWPSTKKSTSCADYLWPGPRQQSNLEK